MYTPAFKPWDHQTKAEDKWADREWFALLMAMRTGKTKVVLDHYGRLEFEGKVQNLCVIAPGGVYKSWEGECRDHLSADLKSRVLVFVWESGPTAAKRAEMKKFVETTDKPRVLLMNVEALSSVKEAREFLLAFLKSGKVLTAIDESVIIGNHKSKRTEFINEDVALESDFRVIMSGLITPRDPLQLFSQMWFLSWTILNQKSFYSYRARYAELFNIVVGNRSVPIVKGFRDLDKLQARIAPHSYRCTLKDVYDAPEKIYLKREITLTPEQKRIYKELKEFSTAELSAESHVTATIVIAKMVRLHQVLCGHTVDEDGVEHDIPENRTTGLLDLLADHEGKAIIWASYDYDVKKISAVLKKEYGENAVSRFWGGNRNTREAEEELFKYNPERLFMVATAEAGGRARKWSMADLTVYYSNRDNLDNRDQSEERAQAVGKYEPCTYVDLMVPGTVDEKIVESLRKKINLSTAINGDNYRDWLI